MPSDTTLHHGDCLDVMGEIPDGSIDAVVTDPPYGIDYDTPGGAQPSAKRSSSTVVKWGKILGDKAPSGDWLAEAYRVMRDGAAIYIVTRWDVEPEWRGLLRDAGFIVKQRLTWHKRDHGKGDLKGTFATTCEDVLFATKGRHILNRRPSMLLDAGCVPTWEKRFHPHQKPVGLPLSLIETSTKAGATILDPFIGSGTTGVACVNTGRNFIGIEKDAGYFAIAERRIADARDAHASRLPLPACPPPPRTEPLAVLASLVVGLSLLVGGQSPQQAYESAYGDLVANVHAENQPYVRYLSLAGIPEGDRPKFLQALSFALNSTHFRKQILPLTVVNGYLVRINLAEFGWDKESRADEIDRLARIGVKFDFKGNARALARFTDIWEDIARLEPYHVFSRDLDRAIGVRGWIDPRLAAEAANLSHSAKFVVSASWLYPRLWVEAADGGFYSQLLLFPTSEQNLYLRLGIDIKEIEGSRGLQGAAVIGPSLVAFHGRELQELASPVGPDRTLWRTSDMKVDIGIEFDKNGVDVRSVTESLANTVKYDGREMIGSLPNGLHFYYLCDSKGKQVNIVPQDIALDRRPEGHDADRNVRNSYMCLSCHGPQSGIYPFQDSIKAVILADPVALGVFSKYADKRQILSRRQEIEEFYLPGLDLRVSAQQASYRFYTFTATGMDPGENSVNVVDTFDRYFWDLVTPAQAALEMSVPLPTAIEWWRNSADLRRSDPKNNLAFPNQNLMFLVAGKSIRRTGWESAYGDAMRGKPGGYDWEKAVRPVAVPVQQAAPAYALPNGYRSR